MEIAFYLASAIAIFASLKVITNFNAVHALLYMIVSLISVSLIFYTLGAPFIAALEVIIYAGAIMVLFIFAAMMLNLGPPASEQERRWFDKKAWIGPAILALILLGILIYILMGGEPTDPTHVSIPPRQISLALFGPYMIGVQLAAFLLLAGMVGAFHLGRR
ncbi:MAG: NADH-quinone oxidoreductase subunit J [Anaerolineales bacterium]